MCVCVRARARACVSVLVCCGVRQCEPDPSLLRPIAPSPLSWRRRYNIPCSPEKDNINNPLVMIKKLCKKEDYVVFKVLAKNWSYH